MTDEAVRNALRAAVRNAFALGVEAGKQAGTAHGRRSLMAGTTLRDVQEYAAQLVLPIVEVRLEQAVEEAAIGAKRAVA